jgi:hypothetical protein
MYAVHLSQSSPRGQAGRFLHLGAVCQQLLAGFTPATAADTASADRRSLGSWRTGFL